MEVLEQPWDEFRAEFSANFDNDEIQLQLRADILTTPQSAITSGIYFT